MTVGRAGFRVLPVWVGLLMSALLAPAGESIGGTCEQAGDSGTRWPMNRTLGVFGCSHPSPAAMGTT
jgi:hypothetical protein